MKITFVLPGYPKNPVGGYKVVYEYANHLVRERHEVAIVHPRKLEGSAPNRSRLSLLYWLGRQKEFFADMITKPTIKWFSLDKKVQLIKTPDLGARHVPDADAIFATHWQTSLYVNDYPSKKGTKFYLVMDYPPWFADKSELEHTWRLPLKKVAISNWLAELVTQAGVPKDDIKAIPIAVDLNRFHLINDVRKRPKRIIMLYSSAPRKRSRLGLSALLECKEAVPNLEVRLFGPLRKRPPQIPSWIEYYGNISEQQLLELYNTASICLCSSEAEGFALPPAEAMACGCAVVTTDCGGNREYAVHEKTALVSDPDDFSSLVSNALRLLCDEELRIRIALAGRERISHFTWEQSTQQLIQFISDNLKT
jgi:L-malate glycosyltransferase